MRQKERPEIGDTMYVVTEHLYYIPGCAAPRLEYCVVAGTAAGFIKGGYTEIKLLARPPGLGMTPIYRPLQEIGISVFYTFDEAVACAEGKTLDYERKWGWTGDAHLRRTWINDLKLKEVLREYDQRRGSQDFNPKW